MNSESWRSQSDPGGPMSVDEYLRLERNSLNARYEYIDGIARLMSGGSVGHDRIARNMTRALEDQFLTGPCTAFGPDVQVLIGIKASGKPHYVYPDSTVSCDVSDRRRNNKLIQSPRIVIEVLSPSTEPLDRGKKLRAYKACPTIHEIVFVSQFSRYIEIHRRSGDDETRWEREIYDPEAPSIELRSVDVTITMDDIYRNIDFDEPLDEE